MLFPYSKQANKPISMIRQFPEYILNCSSAVPVKLWGLTQLWGTSEFRPVPLLCWRGRVNGYSYVTIVLLDKVKE